MTIERCTIERPACPFMADLVNPIKTADQGNNLIKTADLDTFLTIRCRNITKKLFIAELFSKRRHQVSQLSRGNEAVAVLVEVPQSFDKVLCSVRTVARTDCLTLEKNHFGRNNQKQNR